MADPLLHYLPADVPPSYAALPEDERDARGLYFLMAWGIGHSDAYAWWAALATDLDDVKQTVANAQHDLIRQAVIARMAEDAADRATTYQEST